MRVKVTQRQFELLLDNLDWISGASMVMKGKTFRKIIPDSYPLNEQQKMFKVGIWFGSYSTATMIIADSGELARITAGKMFPNATIHTATEINCKLK